MKEPYTHINILAHPGASFGWLSTAAGSLVYTWSNSDPTGPDYLAA